MHEYAAAQARKEARRKRVVLLGKSLLNVTLLKKINLQNTTVRRCINGSAVVGAFIAIAVFVNEPLRSDILQTFNPSNPTNVQDAYDLRQEDELTMRPVMFSYPEQKAEQKKEKPPLIESSVNNLPVPSIAPLANRIPGRIDPQALDLGLLDSRENQQKVASVMAEKYRVDINALRTYVSHAVIVAREVNLDPVLLISVMAIESNFIPTVQSPVGAQGLMQVMTSIHADKYAPYGGVKAAFKPEANIRVGAYILKYFIAQAGSLQGGLRYYVGGANTSDGGYAWKVMREREMLIATLGGRINPSKDSANTKPDTLNQKQDDLSVSSKDESDS